MLIMLRKIFTRKKEKKEPIENLEEFKDHNKYLINALPSGYSEKDYLASDLTRLNRNILPKEYDVRSSLPAVRNQGNQGSCVAQSLACIKEYHENKDVGFESHMSPQFIYNQRSNKPTEGMYLRDALDIARKNGICPEKDYKYGTNKPITEDLLDISQNYKITEYRRINTIDELKSAIFNYGPCLIAFPVYNNTYQMWKKREGDKIEGYHCMSVIGWKKDSFIIRNSWGTFWGHEGYCYYLFEDWGSHVESWMAIDGDSKVKEEDNISTDCGCLESLLNFYKK